MAFLQNTEIDFWSVALRLLLAVVALIIGRWLAGQTRKWLTRPLRHAGLTESLITLIVTLSYYSVLILAVGIALAILGVPPTTIVGIIGVFVIVLAIALQQSLGNLAATIIFLLFKPFVIGDLIETGGILGVVHEIQLFSVVLISGDNKTHVLPSSKIQGDGLTNYSKIGSVRVDLTFGVSYESDISQAIQIIMDLLTQDERVLKEPPPLVFVQNLADNSVEIATWPFVKIADFFPFRREITGKVKDSLDAVGIIIPYPQRDVHLITSNQKSEHRSV